MFFKDENTESTNIITNFDFVVKNEEEREIFGTVLIPEKVDQQGDVYSAQCIKNACIKFNNDVRMLGLMHKDFNDDFSFLYSYVVEDDRGYITVNKKKIYNGTWVLRAKANNDETWERIKSGDLTGWSVSAFIKFIPLEEVA